MPAAFFHASVSDDFLGGFVGHGGGYAVLDGGYLGVAGVPDYLVDLFHACGWFADAEDSADGAGVAPVGGAVFVVDEIALLHDTFGGEAVGVDGAFAADEVHGAGGEVAEVGDHGAVHFGDDFEFGFACGEGVQAGLVDGVVDVGGFSDVGEFGGGFDEFELFDESGGFGDKGVAEDFAELEVVVDAEVGFGDFEADFTVEEALFLEDGFEDGDGVVAGVSVPASNVVGEGFLLCFEYVGEAGLEGKFAGFKGEEEGLEFLVAFDAAAD